MSRCSHVRRDLPLFLGRDLGGARSAEVGRHLQRCQPCRREAMGLQQSLKQLQRITVPSVDESMFTAMHAAIVERVDAELAGGVGQPPASIGRRVWWGLAAAMTLFLTGWWLVRPQSMPAALERPPIAVPVGHADPTRVVPHAGERIPLRLLGDDVVSGEQGAGYGVAPGMMGRWRLRSLVDEPSGEPWLRIGEPPPPSRGAPTRRLPAPK